MIVKSEDTTYSIIFTESMKLTSSEVIGDWIKIHPNCRRILIVTDTCVYERQHDELNRFKMITGDDNALNISIRIITEGENSKSISEAELLWIYMAEIGFCREDLLIAFGGGMIGDLVGFCASTYMRGVSYIQIPTTLLSQIDSSVGGKVGINLDQGKNLIGQFYNPEIVIINNRYLLTLDEDIFIDGLGELIKYGFLGADILLSWLSNYQNVIAIKKIIIDNPLEFECIINQCLEIKRAIVEADYKEKNLRKFLNFGHTIGHAIEQNSGYRLRHGNCVIQGCWWIYQLAIENEYQNELLHMDDKYEENLNIEYHLKSTASVEAQVNDANYNSVNTSSKLEYLKIQFSILEKLMQQYGIDIEKNISVEALLSFLKIDKKNTREGIQFIWPKGAYNYSVSSFLNNSYYMNDLNIIKDEAVLEMVEANVAIKIIPIDQIEKMFNNILKNI